MKRTLRRRGFFQLDAVTGLIIMMVLMIALASIMGYQAKAERKLADVRSAARLAERQLLSMQGKIPAPAANEGTIASRTLKDAAPDGYAWVEVKASVGQATASLTGLMPAAGGAR